MLIDSVENKRKILKNFLEIVAVSGWNKSSLHEALKKSSIDHKFLPLIFPNNLLDLADFYVEENNEILQQKIAKITDFDHQKIRDKIRFCLYQRFVLEQKNKSAISALSHYYFDPKNLFNFEVGFRPKIQALKNCFKIADEIWRLINDQSTDFNFYTKRLTLAKIILQTIPVFLKDEDSELSKTKKFIDSKIEKVMQFEKLKFKTKEAGTNLVNFLQSSLLNSDSSFKKPSQIIKNLPFIRLFKDKF